MLTVDHFTAGSAFSQATSVAASAAGIFETVECQWLLVNVIEKGSNIGHCLQLLVDRWLPCSLLRVVKRLHLQEMESARSPPLLDLSTQLQPLP